MFATLKIKKATIITILVALVASLAIGAIAGTALGQTEIWTRQFGTAGDDFGLALDADGSTYVVGVTDGTFAGFTNAGGQDVVVRKYDVSGNVVWTNQFGTSGLDTASAVAIDATGLYVVGDTTGTFPGQVKQSPTGRDAFIRKLDFVTGNGVFTRQFTAGDAISDAAIGVDADATGVYVLGWTQTVASTIVNFVRKFDTSGNAIWTQTFNGNTLGGISVDASGVYVGTSIISAGQGDVLVRKYDASGNPVWTAQYGTSANDFVRGISVDFSGVYVAGFTDGTFAGQVSAGLRDIFLSRLSKNTGSVVYTAQGGSSANDEANAVVAEHPGVYVAGATQGTFPGQASAGGFSDSFARRYDADTGNVVWTNQFGASGFDEGLGIALDSTGVYVAGDTDGTLSGQTSAGFADVFVIKLAKSDTAPAVCGNNIKEGSEVCDGTDLGGQTCTAQGFAGGTLACNSTCTGFDTSACVAPDTTPPDTTITFSDIPNGESTTATSNTFSFTGTDNVTPSSSLTFECSLDGSAFTVCASPKSYTSLAIGSHNFQVRAKDAVSNIDPTPATRTWTVIVGTGDIDGDGMTNDTETVLTGSATGLTLNTTGTTAGTLSGVLNVDSSVSFSGQSTDFGNTWKVNLPAGSTVPSGTLTIEVSKIGNRQVLAINGASLPSGTTKSVEIQKNGKVVIVDSPTGVTLTQGGTQGTNQNVYRANINCNGNPNNFSAFPDGIPRTFTCTPLAGDNMLVTGLVYSTLFGFEDADSDTVDDAFDLCPGTSVGSTVDENGCAAGQVQINTLKAGTVTAQPGNLGVIIPITLNNPVSVVAGLQFDLLLPSVVSFKQLDSTARTSGAIVDTNVVSGTLKAAALVPSNIAVGSGSIFNLLVDVSPTAAPGDYPLLLSTLFGNEFAQAIASLAQDGLLKIIPSDTVPPIISNNPVTSPTNNPSLTVSGTVTDPDPSSGIASLTINGVAVTLGVGGSYSHTLTLTEGLNNITEVATDNAGNVANKQKQVLLDTQAPTVAKTVNDPDNDGFVNSITLSASDTPKSPATVASGVKEIHYSINGGPETIVSGASANVILPQGTPQITISFFAVDNAGNQELPTTQSHDLDQCLGVAGVYQGCPFGDKNIVDLHIVNLGGGASTKTRLANVFVRVFDRNNLDFQAVAGSKNPDGSLYGVVYEADAGRVGTCTTGADGACTAGEQTTGDYLVIVKWLDSATGKTVYVGRPKSPADFKDTNADGIGDLATKDFQIIKIFKNGVFQGYRGASKVVVTGSLLEIIVPESAVWEGTSSIYPFIFASDSDWTVDVCAEVPTGYSIVGVYDENGNLISTTQCVQTIVANTTKIVAFEVNEVGSPEPSLFATLTLKNPKGQITKLSHKASDLRKNAFNEKVKAAQDKAQKLKAIKKPQSLAPDQSLWRLVANNLTQDSTSTDVEQGVRVVAQENDIAIPEWGIQGRVDAKRLLAGTLINLTPLQSLLGQ